MLSHGGGLVWGFGVDVLWLCCCVCVVVKCGLVMVLYDSVCFVLCGFGLEL